MLKKLVIVVLFGCVLGVGAEDVCATSQATWDTCGYYWGQDMSWAEEQARTCTESAERAADLACDATTYTFIDEWFCEYGILHGGATFSVTGSMGSSPTGPSGSVNAGYTLSSGGGLTQQCAIQLQSAITAAYGHYWDCVSLLTAEEFGDDEENYVRGDG